MKLVTTRGHSTQDQRHLGLECELAVKKWTRLPLLYVSNRDVRNGFFKFDSVSVRF